MCVYFSSDTAQHMIMFPSIRLVTAQILYRLPDHPDFLQTYIWQEHDTVPRFPRLLDFLRFWDDHLEGPIHSVEIAHHKILQPAEWRHGKVAFYLS